MSWLPFGWGDKYLNTGKTNGLNTIEKKPESTGSGWSFFNIFGSKEPSGEQSSSENKPEISEEETKQTEGSTLPADKSSQKGGKRRRRTRRKRNTKQKKRSRRNKKQM
jgi:hypothetical protein